MTTIEPFADEYIEGALALWRATDNVGLSSADEPKRLSEFLECNPGSSFVAVAAGEVIGACLCGHDGRRGYIHHLAVATRHRRDQLGSRLLRRCLAALRAAGIQKCHAFVFHSNRYGELFWKSRGWERRDDLLVYSKHTTASD